MSPELSPEGGLSILSQFLNINANPGLKSGQVGATEQDFGQALDQQLRDGLIELGIDPQQVASMDTKALIDKFRALLQGQSIAISGQSLPTPPQISLDPQQEEPVSLTALQLLLESAGENSFQFISSEPQSKLDDATAPKHLFRFTSNFGSPETADDDIADDVDEDAAVDDLLDLAAAEFGSPETADDDIATVDVDEDAVVDDLLDLTAAEFGLPDELDQTASFYGLFNQWLASNSTISLEQNPELEPQRAVELLRSLLASLDVNILADAEGRSRLSADQQDQQLRWLGELLAGFDTAMKNPDSLNAGAATKNLSSEQMQWLRELMAYANGTAAENARARRVSATGDPAAVARSFKFLAATLSARDQDGGERDSRTAREIDSLRTQLTALFTASSRDVTIAQPPSGASQDLRARFDLARLLLPGGGARLAEQIQLIARAREGSAELRLHPPSLGTIDVRVVMEGERANVYFSSPNSVVRDVLEAAMPRLRDALAQDGLMLGDASVSDQSPRKQEESSAEQRAARSAGISQGAADDGADRELANAPPDALSTLSVLHRKLDLFV